MPHGASCRGILAGQPHAGRGVPGGAALLCPAASCRRAATRRRTTHACRVLARASCPRVPPALFRGGGEAYTPADEPNVRGCQPLSAAPGVTPGAPSPAGSPINLSLAARSFAIRRGRRCCAAAQTAVLPCSGWNSWCSFGPCGTDVCTEAQALETIAAMETNGMKAAGYSYVTLDDW